MVADSDISRRAFHIIACGFLSWKNGQRRKEYSPLVLKV